MTIRFDNRVAIVTGAGNGLGRAHALLLASRGAKVVVNDPGGAVDGKGGDHAAAADKVVAEIKAAGGQAVPNYDSVADAKTAANIVKTAVDSFGTVDIVVNNAGVLRDKTFHNMTIEDFDFVVKVHFLGTAYVTHAAWPIMRAKAYGRVVVTSSNSGIYGNFGQANYGGAKLAVVGFMNALRLEGQKYNILVNALAPVAGTRMTESLMTPEMLAKLEARVRLAHGGLSVQRAVPAHRRDLERGRRQLRAHRVSRGARPAHQGPRAHRRGRGRQHRQDRRPLDQQGLPDLVGGGGGGGRLLNAGLSAGDRLAPVAEWLVHEAG